MVDQNLDIPFGFDYLVKVFSVPYPQFESTWNHERFLSLHSNDISSDKIDLQTVKKILENSAFFMNFKKHLIADLQEEEHFCIVNLCEVATEFYLKILMKNHNILRIEIGTSNFESSSLDLMEFIVRNMYKKLSLKSEESLEENV